MESYRELRDKQQKDSMSCRWDLRFRISSLMK